MSDEVPTHENSVVVFEDKPNLATMISGGIFIAVVLYFFVGLLLSSVGLDLVIVQILMAAAVVVISIKMGSTVEVMIKIDKKTGYIEARDKEYTYQGYAHEPELFMVLEKQSKGMGDRQYKDYKISIKVDDETTFDVPLEVEQVREAIKTVEKAKEAVPLSQK